MSRKNKRVDAAEDLATSAVDRVAPLAQAAADKIAPLAQAAADKVQPLAHSAAEAVSPYAHSAAEAVSPYAHQVADKVAPLAHQAADALEPYAKSARQHGAQLAQDTADKLSPRLDDARDKLQKDVLPALADRLSDAAQGVASSPAAVEAQKRSRAAAAALRGELILPEDEPKKKRWLLRIGVVTALGGLAFFLVKRFKGGQDSDWQTAQPTPYSSATTTAPTEQPGAAGDPVVPGSADLPAPGAAVVADHDSVYEIAPDAKDVAAQQAAQKSDQKADQHEARHADTEPAPAADGSGHSDGSGDSGSADDSDSKHGAGDRADYGEHSFIGAEPPQGFTIKANERSKKYHLPDSAGYGRTQTEVWFDTAEAAEAAGFVQATH